MIFLSTELVLLIMEWVGTVSFAASGALVAIRHSLDLFGVLTVGTITAVGGGVIRDILIGNVPPKIFSNLAVLLVAALVSLVVFVVAYFFRKNFQKISEKIDTVNLVFDALGLGAFSIAGIEVTRLLVLHNNAVLIIFLGAITGVGGGVLRDILVNEKPYILTKHVYAVASILGCLIYYILSVKLNHTVLATVLVLTFVVSVRALAAKFHWKLPKIKID